MALPYWQRCPYDSIYVSAHHCAYREALDLALGKALIDAACERAISSLVANLGGLIVSFGRMGRAFADSRQAFDEFYDAMLADSVCACEECTAEETWN